MSTPVQRQYWSLKNEHPSALLFFRLGDFYELFYEDAILASRLLGITLTARHKGTENEMPMCGFPFHAHQEYLEKLVDRGYSVAIAEQKEGEGGKITREIVRLVTPGTTLEPGNLDPESPHYLAVLEEENSNWGLSWVDISTGEFFGMHFSHFPALLDQISLLNPSELLMSGSLFQRESWSEKFPKNHLGVLKSLKSSEALLLLKKTFGSTIDEIGNLSEVALIQASGMLIGYLQTTQKVMPKHLRPLKKLTSPDFLNLDERTLHQLELFRNSEGNTAGSLLWVFEKPFTALGGRTLRRWLMHPLRNKEKIEERQVLVQWLLTDSILRESLESHLKKIPDFERILGRIGLGRATPRDLGSLRDGLFYFKPLADILSSSHFRVLEAGSILLSSFDNFRENLASKLLPELPIEMNQGGVFKEGVSQDLDEWRRLSLKAEAWLEAYLEKEKKDHGFQNLKVKYSPHFGFCLELTNAQTSKAPVHWIRRQTLVGGERFSTPELLEYEKKTLSAKAQSFEWEYQAFLKLREESVAYLQDLQKAADFLGQIDALLSFARTAQKLRWICPQITPPASGIYIQAGRHPVVEKMIQSPFVPNDLRLGEESDLQIITGPNMAGKSTFLRQNALIILLAQMGSFVPAEKAQISITDRICTRMGAGDRLSRGQSTFFVEMIEVAQILHQATNESFIILDELGRGTSTFDGLSLAWAITEYLHDEVRAKTLIATHYHQLVELGERLLRAANYHVAVAQNEKGLLFLHEIRPGGMADSFGIQVAQSAGIPLSIVERAKTILLELEKEPRLGGAQLSLFS